MYYIFYSVKHEINIPLTLAFRWELNGLRQHRCIQHWQLFSSKGRALLSGCLLMRDSLDEQFCCKD